MIHIEFALEYWTRRDDDAKAFVAYVPTLRLYAQSKEEQALGEAVKHLIADFIGICHERGILPDVMRERGMSPVSKETATKMKLEVKNRKGSQYIIVGNVAKERYEVPITLLAGKAAMAACHGVFEKSHPPLCR